MEGTAVGQMRKLGPPGPLAVDQSVKTSDAIPQPRLESGSVEGRAEDEKSRHEGGCKNRF